MKKFLLILICCLMAVSMPATAQSTADRIVGTYKVVRNGRACRCCRVMWCDGERRNDSVKPSICMLSGNDGRWIVVVGQRFCQCQRFGSLIFRCGSFFWRCGSSVYRCDRRKSVCCFVARGVDLLDRKSTAFRLWRGYRRACRKCRRACRNERDDGCRGRATQGGG